MYFSTIFAPGFANPKNTLLFLLTDYTMATEFCSYQMSLYVVSTYLMLKWHFHFNIKLTNLLAKLLAFVLMLVVGN